jgi:hypothetical protein
MRRVSRRLYGFGTALTTLPISYLIDHGGYRTAFILFGAIQGLVVLISAQFLRMPPLHWSPPNWEAIKENPEARLSIIV